MNKIITVELCMGSSCFARGNNITAPQVQKIITARQWTERVILKGALCQGGCKEGPNVRVNGKAYSQMDMAALLDIIEENMARSEA